MAQSLLSSKLAEAGDRGAAIDGYKRIIEEHDGTEDMVMRSYVRGAKEKLRKLEVDKEPDPLP